MRKLVLAVSTALAILSGGVSHASAADISLPLPLSYTPAAAAPRFVAANWTGFYVGGHLGYSLSQEFGRTSFTGLGERSIATDNAWLGGFQVGMNYQFAHKWVAGLETDITWGRMGGARTDNFCSPPFCFPPVSIRTSGSLDWQGTTRARLGYLLNDRMLVYGTGGLAYGGVSTSMRIQCTLCNFPVDTRGLGVGWVAGAGIEWAFMPSMPNLTAKFEYLHIQLEGPKTVFPGGWIRPDIAQDVVKVGLNYRF